MRTQIILLALVALLSAALWSESQTQWLSKRVLTASGASPANADETIANDSNVSARPQFSQPVVTPLALLTQTVERPLFSESRREVVVEDTPTPDVEAVAVAVAEAPQLLLHAIVIDGADRVALVSTSEGDGPALRLREGQSFNGWRIERVGELGIALRHGDVTHEVALRDFEAQTELPRVPATSRERPRRARTDSRPRTEQAARRATRGPRQRSSESTRRP